MLKTYTLKVIVVLVYYLFSHNILAQEESKVYYFIHKVVNKVGTNNSEDSYRTDMLPATISPESAKKLKAVRGKMWATSSSKIRTIQRKLSKNDRVVIIKFNYKNSEGNFSKIIIKKFLEKSKDYKIGVSEIVEKEMKASMMKEYYKNNEVLFDGIPFSNSVEERKTIKENVKKAVAIGVRG